MFVKIGLPVGIVALVFSVFGRPISCNPAPEPQQVDRIDKAFQMMDAKCGGEAVTVPKALNDSLYGCAKTAKEEWAATGKKGMMPLTRLACAGVCVLQGFGLLDEAGKPTNDDKVLTGYVQMLSEKLRQPAIDQLQACVKNNAKKLVMKPGDCSSYGLMLLCIKTSLEKLCRS